MWIEKTADGKYRYVERYTDPRTGKVRRASLTRDKKSPQMKKKMELELTEKIRKLKAASEHGREEGITLKRLADLYFESKKVSVALSTAERDYKAAKTMCKILGEDTLLENVYKLDILGLLDKYDGPNAGKKNERIKRFKTWMLWARRHKYIMSVDFLDELTTYKDRSHRTKIKDKFLEVSEYHALVTGMEVKEWKLLTQFLVMSGLRIGELTALNVMDVDLKEKKIHVRKSYDAAHRKITRIKTESSIRDVHMQPELLAVTKEINSFMMNRNLLNGVRTDIFFPAPDGDYLRYYTYNKYLRENSKKICDHQISVHALRHTSASLMFEQGFSMEEVARRLGHSTSKVTREIYVHVTKTLQKKDSEKLDMFKIG